MSAETLLPNPLEQYADEYANEVFTPLYLNDLFYLDQVKQYPNVYYPLIRELTAKWTVPDETQRQVETDIQLYCPYEEEK